MPQPQKTILQDYQERIARLEERCKDVARRYEFPQFGTFVTSLDGIEGVFPYLPMDRILSECVKARVSPDVVIETYAQAFHEEAQILTSQLQKERPHVSVSSREVYVEIRKMNQQFLDAAIYAILKSPNL